MSIEERLEAISMHMELLARMQHENEERFAQVTRNFEIVHESIKGLEVIAMAHQQRLDEIQGEQ